MKLKLDYPVLTRWKLHFQSDLLKEVAVIYLFILKSSLFVDFHSLFTLFDPLVYFAGRGRGCDEQGDGSWAVSCAF